MKVGVCSRMIAADLIKKDFPKNVSVISFYTPLRGPEPNRFRVDYSEVCDHVFYVGIPDIDESSFDEYGYSEETYIENASELADFIFDAKENGRDIICQCDFGRSRSAGCAAAILEYFYGCADKIFLNDKYCPNLMVFEKVFSALHEKIN